MNHMHFTFFLAALVPFQPILLAQTFMGLHAFTGATNDGGGPSGGLVLSGNTIYGVTATGGLFGGGIVYRINTDGTAFAVLHSFTYPYQWGNTNSDGATPVGGLVLAEDTLYGTASQGGAWGLGTVFKLMTNGSGYATLHSFGLGTDGCTPLKNLVLTGGGLYGVTSASDNNAGQGTVFTINADGTGYRILHSFDGQDGADPDALFLYANELYGMTEVAGPFMFGTLFEMTTNGTSFSLPYSWASGAPWWGNPRDCVLAGNAFYGVVYDDALFGIFRVSTDGTGFSVIYTNDSIGYASMAVLGDSLYFAMTTNSSRLGSPWGSIFKMNTNGTALATVHTFDGGLSEQGPYDGLLLSGTTLYGTASGNGPTTDGILFALTLAPDPIPIQAQLTGANLILTWTNSTFVLQSAPSPSGAYTNVPGASNPWTNGAIGPQMFFRLHAD